MARTRIARRKVKHYAAFVRKRRQTLLTPNAPKDREKGKPHDFTSEDWHYALAYWGGCCAVCGRTWGQQLTIAKDHWIPISRRDTPGTIPSNILPLCHGKGGCNNDKSNLHPLKWLKSALGKERSEAKRLEIETFFKTVRKTAYDE